MKEFLDAIKKEIPFVDVAGASQGKQPKPAGSN
jgi:hypothetical protein